MKTYRIKVCSCGAVLELSNADDILCQKCGKTYNRMGREVTRQNSPFIKDRPPRRDIIFR